MSFTSADIRQYISRSMRVNGNDFRTIDINSTKNQVRFDIALIPGEIWNESMREIMYLL